MAPLAYSSDMAEPGSFQNLLANRPEVEIIEISSSDDDDSSAQSEQEYEDEEIQSIVYDEDDESEQQEDEDDDEDEDDEDEDGGEVEAENESIREVTNGFHGTQSRAPQGAQLGRNGLVTAKPVSSALPTGTIDVQRALHPLRHTADRVLNQIEVFAQNLDKFRKHTTNTSTPELEKEACTLVKKYQKVAHDSMAELTKSSSASRKPRIPNLSASRGGNTSGAELNLTPTEEEKYRKWELEAETWNLFIQLFNLHTVSAQQKELQARETVLQELHRYSSDREVWEGFLRADNFARECATVLRWLEKSAKRETKELDSLISDLENDAERGQGLWAHGWLYTKEAIKGAKRLRSWPQPIDPADPGIATSLLSTAEKVPLITQLDPDAVVRQQLGLEKQDKAHEQATWITCWKMLRLGQSWSQIREWAHERLENWRAVSVCGASEDTTTSSAADDLSEFAFVRMMKVRSQESWHAACLDLANNPTAECYEQAVYALLAGEIEPALKACHSWSDFVFVYYNHLLITRYRDFCKKLHRKLNYTPTSKSTISVDPQPYDAIYKFLENLKNGNETSAESRNPFRAIQAAILTRTYEHFFRKLAGGVAAVTPGDPSSLLLHPGPVDAEDWAADAVRDEFSVRIVAHLFLLAWHLGYTPRDPDFIMVSSLNVVAYTEIIRSSGNSQYIPLYTAFLPQDAMNSVLSRLLIDIVKPDTRAKFVHLMKIYNINLADVLDCQWDRYISELNAKDDLSKPVRLKRSVIREPNGAGRIGNIKKKLVGHHVPYADERLIRCMHWHRYLEGRHWSTKCARANHLYKRFFVNGRLASARQLWDRVKISDMLTDSNLLEYLEGTDGEEKEVDMTDNNITQPSSAANGIDDDTPSYPKLKRDRLECQLHTMRELEQLIEAFDALEDWADLLHEFQSNTNRQTREKRNELQYYLDKVTEAVQPLCVDGFLKHPIDAIEDAELKFLRDTYLPEAIFAYHSALYYASQTLGREILVQCMGLAITVARSASLISAFLASDRLPELVDTFAHSSMAVMAVKDTKLKKRLPQNATLDIWKVKLQDEADSLMNLDMD